MCEHLNAIGLLFSILRLFAVFMRDKAYGDAYHFSLLLHRDFPITEYVLCVLEKQQTKQNQKFFGLSLRLKEIKKKQMK